MSNRISRRSSLMTVLLPIVAVSGMASAAPAAAADAELIALCRRYLAMEDEQDQLCALMFDASDAGDKAEEERLFEEQRTRVPTMHRLLHDLLDLPALTAEGIRLKAEVALRRVQVDLDGDPVSDEDAVMRSLAQDMVRLAGGAA